MVKQKTIDIQFDTFGNVKADAKGFTGNSCSVETGAILNVLGGSTADEKKKPEYYQSAGQSVEAKARW